MLIHWLGHATFRIETQGKIIYIDPYILPKNSPLADIIIITHDHFDHLNMEKIGEIRQPKTVFVGNQKVAEKIGEGTKILDYWGRIEIEGIGIKSVPAYNPKKDFHPKGFASGYVIDSEGKTIYHAADTDLIPEMNRLEEIDVAMLPIGGTYTMDVEDAVRAALIIRPKIVIPMHYNTIQGTEADVDEFIRKIEENSSIKVEIPKEKPVEL